MARRNGGPYSYVCLGRRILHPWNAVAAISAASSTRIAGHSLAPRSDLGEFLADLLPRRPDGGDSCTRHRRQFSRGAEGGAFPPASEAMVEGRRSGRDDVRAILRVLDDGD